MMEKKNLWKIIFTTEEGNLIISSYINARKYSEEILRRLTFKYFGKNEKHLRRSVTFSPQLY